MGMPDQRRIGFTGDVMLGRLVNDHQQHQPPTAVWGDMLPDLQALDGLFINLECCISTRGEPWTETYRPFHFRADPEWAIPALTTADVDWACLANNHLLDYGEPALLDTLEHLETAGIAFTGAGPTFEYATQPSIVHIADLTVGLVAFTDNTPEFAAAPDSPGTAHITIDPDNPTTEHVVTRAINQATEHDPDLLVASLHWGPNMVERPPESFRAFARWLVDQGIDLIHGHSAHIFQAIEIYDGTPILYDTGDFVDDYAIDPDLRNDRSFLFELHTTPDGSPESLRLIPTEIRDCAVHHAPHETARWSLRRMEELSEPFGTTYHRHDHTLYVPIH